MNCDHEPATCYAEDGKEVHFCQRCDLPPCEHHIVIEDNRQYCEKCGLQWKTRFGRYLARPHLDEVPKVLRHAINRRSMMIDAMSAALKKQIRGKDITDYQLVEEHTARGIVFYFERRK